MIKDEDIAQINENTVNSVLSYESAKEYIYKILNKNNSVSDPVHNLCILDALRVIMACEFGLHQNQIVYNIKSMDDRKAMASIQCNRGDGFYYIFIGKNFLLKENNLTFLRDVLHEYGHLKLYFDLKNGKKFPASIVTDSEKYKYANDWQRHGADVRYFSNNNEFGADKFSYDKLKEWIKERKSKGLTTKNLKVCKRVLTKSERKRIYGYRLSKLEYALWKCVNKILGVEDKCITEIRDGSVDVLTVIWEQNKKYPLAVNSKSIKESYRDLAYYFNEEDLDFKRNSSDYRQKKVFVATRKMRVLLADKFGISSNEIGFMFDDGGNECKVIDARRYNKNSKLSFYIVCPERKIDTYSSVREYITDVMQKIEKMIEERKEIAENGQ